MKIAIIGSRGYPYVYSGYETFVKELSERLVIKGVKVTVYCHKNLFKDFPSVVNGINLIYLPTIEKKSLSQFIHSFQSILHACLSDFDIIFVVNSANGPFGLITRIFKKRTAINVDGLEWLRPKWKGLGAKYFYFASWISTKLYDVIINDSFEMKRIYKELFKKDSTVIAYGANISYSEKPELIKKWNLEKNGYYLIVGRLVPDNNADLIASEFVKSNSVKKMVIVGDVTYQDEYALKIKKIKNDRVLFTGYVNDQYELAELYNNCYAYIHGHEYGGTNPTMLTALACGCAIIAIDTLFTREMCDNEKHAIYFDKQAGTLASILRLIECDFSIIKSMRKVSRKRIISNYTWEKIANQYDELFKKIIHL